MCPHILFSRGLLVNIDPFPMLLYISLRTSVKQDKESSTCHARMNCLNEIENSRTSLAYSVVWSLAYVGSESERIQTVNHHELPNPSPNTYKALNIIPLHHFTEPKRHYQKPDTASFGHCESFGRYIGNTNLHDVSSSPPALRLNKYPAPPSKVQLNAPPKSTGVIAQPLSMLCSKF